MLDYKLKIGILPIRRWLKVLPIGGGFHPKYALENKNRILPIIKEKFADENTEFVDIEWLNEEGLLCLESDCDKVIEYFKEQKIDALFIINCNFGNENCAGIVGKALHLPTLLWGPMDHSFDGMVRYTDTQCGLFSMSKQLKRNNVKFTYINNCEVEDEKFAKEFNSFLSVCSMLKNFNNMKILQVGTRIRAFKSVMYNELELCEKFGIDVQTFNLADFEAECQDIWDNHQDWLDRDLAKLKEDFDMSQAEGTDEIFKRSLVIVYGFERLAQANNCNIISGECWSGIKALHGAYPCLAMSLLAEKNIFVTCESDMHMSITNVLLLAASRGKELPLQGEFTCRNPNVPNSELLWHCGPFPTRYRVPGTKPMIVGVKPAFKCQDGEYTIARFQAEKGKYYLLAGSFHTCDGPKTGGTHLWAQFKDLDKVERKFIEGPYIHHMTEIKGNYVAELKEFAKYADLIFDPLED